MRLTLSMEAIPSIYRSKRHDPKREHLSHWISKNMTIKNNFEDSRMSFRKGFIKEYLLKTEKKIVRPHDFTCSL